MTPSAPTPPENRSAARPASRRYGWFSGLTGRQAMITLLVAVLLGGVGSAIELVLDWQSRQSEIQRNTRQVMAMMEGAAQAAAYTLDNALSQQVVQGLLDLSTVAHVRLVDDYGSQLAAASREPVPDNSRLALWLFGDITRYALPLHQGGDAAGRLLGHLEVELSAAVLADTFLSRAAVNAGLELARDIAICALIAGIFTVMVTRPMVRLAQAVGRVDPSEPARHPVEVPRNHDHDEIGDLAGAMNALLVAFQNSLIQRDRALAENMRLGAEIDISRRLQQMVLPAESELSAISGLDIATYMEPANEVGGDYYDVLQQQNGGVRIGIGDVTGHGLESGVIMLMTQSAVRTMVTSQEADTPHLLDVLNRTLYRNLQRMGSERNLTLALVEYQPLPGPPGGPASAPPEPAAEPAGGPAEGPAGKPTGRLRICGQHESVLIVREDGRLEIIDTLELGMPIGLVDDIASFVGDTETLLYHGDVVVLYTDGITEAANTTHRLYGLERLCQVVQTHRNGSAEDIKAAVLADVTTHIGEQPIWDDLTLIVLKQR